MLDDEQKIKYMAEKRVQIANACFKVEDIIFKELECKKEIPFWRPLYNLIAESFKDLVAFELLFENSCWTQAGIILRTLIERTAKLTVLAEHKYLIILFLDRCDEYKKYIVNKANSNEKAFLESIDLKNARLYTINNYFDFGWADELCENGKANRDKLLKIARLDELIIEIQETLNSFVHGNLSIFDFHGGKSPWEYMKQEGERLSVIFLNTFVFIYTACYKLLDKNILKKELYILCNELIEFFHENKS